MDIPSGMANMAIENIENMALGRNDVSFPVNSMVMFHSFVNVYQRVNHP